MTHLRNYVASVGLLFLLATTVCAAQTVSISQSANGHIIVNVTGSLAEGCLTSPTFLEPTAPGFFLLYTNVECPPPTTLATYTATVDLGIVPDGDYTVIWGFLAGGFGPVGSTLSQPFSVQNGALLDITVRITPSAPTTADLISVQVYLPQIMLRAQSYSVSGNTVTVTIDNTGVSFLPNPPGVATQALGPLPAGTYTFVTVVLPDTQPVATKTVIVVPSSKPVEGMWWDPTQSGSGYAIDVRHGVLLMTVFSYTTTGSPQWYVLYGALVNNSVTAQLLKFTGGQCISCAVWQQPLPVGDDGMATVTFTSPTTATILLPGGRITHIVPDEF